MTVRSDTPCQRCGGPALHPGVCVDSDGQVYPPYASLATAWQEQGRPAMTVDEVIELQEALSLAAGDDEPR